MNFNPFPTLQTERFNLRKTSTQDLEDLLFLRSNPIVNQYIDRPLAQSLKDAEDFLTKIAKGLDEGKNVYWTISYKGNDQMIGSICLWNFSENGKIGEVGYDLKPEFHGQGIMTEVLKSILIFGFEQLQLEKIEAYTHHQNEASKRLLVKNNFRLVEGKKDEFNQANIVFEIH